METIKIPAADGFELSATLYRGGDAVIVVNSATATPQRFYKPFAMFLVEQGYTVVTYDYRGIGASAPASLRGFEAQMSDWALLDMQSVVAWVSAEFNPIKLIVVGHSIGGQAMGMLTNSDKIDAMITASAQSGYWRLQGGNQKWVVLLHMYATFPLLANVLGYFPWSKATKSATDLPKGVALQWAKWCRNPRYLLGDASLPLDRYQQFTAPVLALSFDDDDWGTAEAVDAMMGAYPNVTRRHIKPSEFALGSLGHFGLFRPKSAPIWHELVAWIREQTHVVTNLPAA